MQITKNFSFEELTFSATARQKGIHNLPNPPQIENLRKLCEKVLQPVRDNFGAPITVTSGFRSTALNKAVGGAPGSQHLKGEAADIICYDNRRLWNLMCRMVRDGEMHVGQLINEKNLKWIHVSLPDASHSNQIFHLP